MSLNEIDIIIKTMNQYYKHTICYLELIASSNPHICALGIMLAKINDRKELKSQIQQKLLDTNSFVREQAFSTFISFIDNLEDFEFLINHFYLTSEKIQEAIVKCFTKCPDKQFAVTFLNSTLENVSLAVKIEAFKSILKLDFNTIKQYKNSENPEIKKVYLHALDIYL